MMEIKTWKETRERERGRVAGHLKHLDRIVGQLHHYAEERERDNNSSSLSLSPKK
jgi:hypothetical protein